MVEDRARESGMIYKRLVSGMIGAIPTGYKACPEEMATPTAFLCSGAASYTTGETIRVAAECAIII